MDVSGVTATGLQDVDPQTVETQAPPAQIHLRCGCKGVHLPVDVTLEPGEGRGARGQVRQGGVGGIAAIAVPAAPGTPGTIVLGRLQAGIGAGYDRRKFIAAPGTILASANGLTDENWWVSANVSGVADKSSPCDAAKT